MDPEEEEETETCESYLSQFGALWDDPEKVSPDA